MKCAFIKQKFDVFGSWKTINWLRPVSKQIEILSKNWPGKASLFFTTISLKADWYVIEECIFSDYHNDLIDKIPYIKKILEENTKNVISLKEIPLEEYDIIITLDPILTNFKVSTHGLLCYIANEHWDRIYNISKRIVFKNYDYFLDHMMLSSFHPDKIPTQVAFPLLIFSKDIYSYFQTEKKEQIYMDWRTLDILIQKEKTKDINKIVSALENKLEIKVKYRNKYLKAPYGITNPLQWGDIIEYYKNISECKYYISVGRKSGAGQGIVDGAIMGCICIGEKDKIYHQLICHPYCLCEYYDEFIEIFNRIKKSYELQLEILEWQKWALNFYFYKRPMQILEKGIEIKRKKF